MRMRRMHKGIPEFRRSCRLEHRINEIRMVTDKILHREHKEVQKSFGYCFGVPTV
jgi:hypothetical protein